ncbi:O-acetyltransferase OatA [Porphyridium purpureum]|uniref:O-acetyltransferase OatA n=1 Tax=Porphyridium purpureum TaxID=35688 RepID=A0A5J4YG01_PORPP|nr:O-acetyltransferase OatA [Porphyridium purpureum]|eukprot:POR1520..scf279_48
MSADEMLLPATPTTASKASRGRGIVVRTLEYFVDSDVPPHWLPHLDGLRAIALLGVLLYHFELLACLGGFTGVDVFLVLSGFLMTRNIMKKIATDSFVLSEFYKGRFWRLYPSSLFTTTLTMMLAYFIFSPTLAYDTVRSGFSSMLLSSNILFSTEVGGYFDKSVILKPLLHTWSLSLEEQYYLFWPLFLIVTASLQKPVLEPWFVVIVAGLSLISFVLACVLVYPMATFSWYMLPTRIYEFTIGCLVHVFFPRMTSWPRMLQNSLCSLGLLGILWSYFFLDDNTRFPGWASIPSTVGAALIILSPNSHISRLFLCNKALRWLGKISYAAYLLTTDAARYLFIALACLRRLLVTTGSVFEGLVFPTSAAELGSQQQYRQLRSEFPQTFVLKLGRRARCKPDGNHPVENGGSATPVEQLAPGIVTIGIFKRAQPRAIFLGDSFVGNLVPSFNILARDLGVYFAGVLANGCFTLISEPEDRQELYINARKNGREECRASTRTAQRLVEDLKFKTTFFSYSAAVDSWASPDLAAAKANSVMSEVAQAPQFKGKVSL